MRLITGGRGHVAHATDELYQVPLDQFTATRDALAARLKAAGDKDGAAAAKSVKKPSVPAWAANQVVWQARAEWERLRAAAEALRRKQEEATSADELRQAGRDQRDALAACEACATDLLGRHGHAASPAVLQKVGHTLLALAYGAPDATPGRVDHELQPPGFEALAGLTLAPPPPRPVPAAPAGPVPETTAADATDSADVDAKREAAEQKAEDEERARRRAALAHAEGRVAEAERTAEQARQRLAAEEEAVTALQRRLETARATYEDARSAVKAAETEASAARAALRDLQA